MSRKTTKARTVSYGDGVVGRTIKMIRPMTEKETTAQGWPYYPGTAPAALELDDGTILYPTAPSSWREEGADVPARLFGSRKTGQSFVLVQNMEAGTVVRDVPVEKTGRPPKALPRVAAIGHGRAGQKA